MSGQRLTSKAIKWTWFAAAVITLLFGVAAPDWQKLAGLIFGAQVDKDSAVVMVTVAVATLPAVLGVAGCVALWMRVPDGWDWRGLVIVSAIILVVAGAVGSAISPVSALDTSQGGYDIGSGAVYVRLPILLGTLMVNAYVFTYGLGVAIAAASIGVAGGLTIAWAIQEQTDPAPG